MEQHQTFGPDPTNVAPARHFVSNTLAQWGFEPDDTCLLTNELVTNAVVHARTEFTVSIECLDQRVRVAVTDLSPRLPLLEPVPTDDTTGRGLALIEVLAETWGIETAQRQKTVWFEVVAQQMAASPLT